MTTRITLKSVRTIPTDFGYMANLDLPKGKEYDAVILCYNKGRGLEPIQLCLTHQVYLEKLERIYEEHGGSYHFEVVAIPVCSKDYIIVLDNHKDFIVSKPTDI